MFSPLALMMVMMWPLVVMFLIELHFAIDFWRRLGVWTYLVLFIEWLPVGFAIYFLRDVILYYQFVPGVPFLIVGVVAIALGIALHSWTIKLLGVKATVGYTEIKPDSQSENQGLITSGPFSVVRHPSYWAHTAIIAGIFLITGVISVGIVAIIDLAITNFITTKIEDRELLERFGNQFAEYKKKVPRFFPKMKLERK